MLIFLLRRLGYMAATMVAVSFVVFLLYQASPGNVATKVLGPYSSEEQRDIWLEKNGFKDPFYQQYGRWLVGFATGDLGVSTRFKAPVNDILWDRLANTGVLAALVFGIMVPVSLLLGVFAGMNEGSLRDRVISVVCIITTSLPEFASAVLLSFIFVFYLGWLPGTASMADGFNLLEILLPVGVLVLYDFGYVARMTRASMSEVMTTHYIRTAILKGLPHYRVILRHALRNALIAPFTVIMLQLNWLLSGVIVVEAYFSYKGFGALLLEAALNDDIFVIQACTMVAVFVAVTSQTLADIGYTYLNPRIRFG